MTTSAQEPDNDERGAGCGQQPPATAVVVLTAPPVAVARAAVLSAALRCLQADLGSEAPHANSAAEAEYADEQLALAANALVASTNALPKDSQPIGWSLIVLTKPPTAGE